MNPARLEQLANEINVRLKLAGKADDHEISATQLISEAKGLVPSGQWERWQRTNLSLSPRRVREIMLQGGAYAPLALAAPKPSNPLLGRHFLSHGGGVPKAYVVEEVINASTYLVRRGEFSYLWSTKQLTERAWYFVDSADEAKSLEKRYADEAAREARELADKQRAEFAASMAAQKARQRELDEARTAELRKPAQIAARQKEELARITAGALSRYDEIIKETANMELADDIKKVATKLLTWEREYSVVMAPDYKPDHSMGPLEEYIRNQRERATNGVRYLRSELQHLKERAARTVQNQEAAE